MQKVCVLVYVNPKSRIEYKLTPIKNNVGHVTHVTPGDKEEADRPMLLA